MAFMNRSQRTFLAILALAALLAVAGLTVLAQGSGRLLLPVVLRGSVSSGTPLARINFQPVGAVVPDGYTPDFGLVYGPVPGGLAYGWNSDNSATTRERNSTFAFDQRYDTLIHMQKAENPFAVWEIAVPPGTYDVYVVAGDPDFYDGYFRVAAEGVLVVDGQPTERRRFVDGVVSVTVTDGRLTITNAAGAENNKLAFVEIYSQTGGPLPTVTPTPVVTPSPTMTPSPTPPGQMTEMRGLWVTRFDWTSFNRPADPARIDQIVNDAAGAGFNAIFFQVRGSADAYYTPGLEPWAPRVSGGTLGQPPDPLWDPLAYFVEKAQARGIQLHAYINVHPVWDNCTEPPPETTPRGLYYLLRDAYGETNGTVNALQWTAAGEPHCSAYWRFSPAASVANDHVVAVAADLVNRYAIDGIHLDHVRYGGGTLSCDPVSEAAYGAPCFGNNGQLPYDEWQRRQINGLVQDIYESVILPARRQVMLSAAVWPIYRDYWGWGVRDGYSYYYQDSQAWIKGGYIDTLSPMIYPGSTNCPDDSFWTQSRWQTLVTDFQANSGGRFVVPGIGTAYCEFSEIEWRINKARELGTAGHALFSYSALAANAYFDDLANGPYAQPAVVPPIPWHE